MPRVLALQDLSSLGRCSLAAALPVLSALGVQACPAPTALFSAQTGFAPYATLDCAPWLAESANAWAALGFAPDAFLLGYFATEEQQAAVHALLLRLRRNGALVLVDPVLGDNGALYAGFDPARVQHMQSLLALADVVTPNLTEACLLCHFDYPTFCALPFAAQQTQVQRFGAQLRALGPAHVVITGWHHQTQVLNWVDCHGHTQCFASPAVPGSFSGTGDLLAACLCGLLVQGKTLPQAMPVALAFLAAALADADPLLANHGLPFEPHLALLWEALQ